MKTENKEKYRQIERIIEICDEAVDYEQKNGSAYGVKCAKEVAFEHIYKIVKGDKVE